MMHVVLSGGGLVGALLSTMLAKKGYMVTVIEKRCDIRKMDKGEGRSINLAVSNRGLRALEIAGLKERVLRSCVKMEGRQVHLDSEEQVFHAYGKRPEECIHSISRTELNQILIDASLQYSNVTYFFESTVTEVDFENKVVVFKEGSKTKIIKYDKLLGTDGAPSGVRSALCDSNYGMLEVEELGYGYKEFLIPAQDCFLKKNALHIWPRHQWMFIALPNLDGSFTGTLFLPWKGAGNSFEGLHTESLVQEFQNKYLSDTQQMMPRFAAEFMERPTGNLATYFLSCWNVGEDVLLLGDAAHAIVPFFGQGMNCGFEDCEVLMDEIENGWDGAMGRVFQKRKPNCDAIARMAQENFIEMRDKVSDPVFLKKQLLEKDISKRFSNYISRYRLVSFSCVPYQVARELGELQERLLDRLYQDGFVDEDYVANWLKTESEPRLAPFYSELKGLVGDEYGKNMGN